MTYKNPIIPGFFPDPSICEADGEFYIVNSSFDYFPGIPIHTSNDLINWEHVGYALTTEEQLPLTRERNFPVSQGIYAPTIRYHEGIFYVITTNMTTMQTFFVWSKDPKKGWSDIIIIKNFIGYDPSLFFENDKAYLTASAMPISGAKEGIIQALIDIETGELLSEIDYIWDGSGSSTPEGPHLFKKDNWYYLTAAEGGTEFGHMQTISRSRNPFGPFENNPSNPIVSNRSTILPIQATGHSDLLELSDGRWLAVLHGIRPLKGHKVHYLGRETCLVPVEWTEDGWPILGKNTKVELEFESITGGQQKHKNNWKDNFENNFLSVRWNSLRNLKSDSWALNKGLELTGNEFELNNSMKTPVFIGCRQQDPECFISVNLDFIPIHNNEEAGVTIFMNENFHYDFYKIRDEKSNYLVLRKHVGDIVVSQRVEIYSDQSLTLKIKALNDKYSFYADYDNQKDYLIGAGETRLLSKEIAGGFTGVFIGMYATGNGKKSESVAKFSNFIYEIS